MTGFEEKPYWRTPFADNISSLLPRIKKFNEGIRKFVADPVNNANDLQAFLEEHRTRFIEEHNRAPAVQLENLSQGQAQRLQRKRDNVTATTDYLFGNSIIVDQLRVDFNLELAITIHQMISQGLIEGAGIYRQRSACPSGYNFNYLDPTQIENNLQELFRQISRPIEPGNDEWYNVATEFFNKFLFAHPFSNGNGRVARFLLSALLINYTIIPVCLFAWKSNSNEIYLRVLQEAHEFHNDKLLKSFIIEAVHGTLEECARFLEIPDS